MSDQELQSHVGSQADLGHPKAQDLAQRHQEQHVRAPLAGFFHDRRGNLVSQDA